MAMCFPSFAPIQLWKFHQFPNPSATSLHSAGVLGHGIDSSRYSFRMAAHVSGMILLIELCATLKPYCSDLLLSPVARYHRVMASCRPG